MSQTSLEHLYKKINRINKERVQHIDELHYRFDQLCMLSLEGKKTEHREMMDKLGETIGQLWKFDRKLQRVNSAIEKVD